jgi:GR25 family glycosyltransferase involved in LPS biosynthesis
MLDTRIDNWSYIQKQCKKYLNQIPQLYLAGDGHLRIFDCQYSYIDKNELPPRLPSTTSYPTWMTARSMNAYNCHMGLLKQAYDDKIEILLMLEDDIIFEEDFSEIWNKCEGFFLNNYWDIILFGAYHNKNTTEYITQNILKITNSGGTHGWLLKPQIVVPKILQYGPIAPVDTILSQYVQNTLTCYSVYPSIISQKSGFSNLEQSYLNKPSRYHI